MMKRIGICALVALLLVVGSATGVCAQEKEKSLTELAQEAIDKSKAEASVPGEQHKHLAAMAGSWTYSGKIWMDPSGPPMEVTGTSEHTMIMQGRFLQQEGHSEFQGTEFAGFGLVGFNKMTNKLQSVWIDNTGTAMLIMTGTCDAEGKTFTSFGEFKDLMKSDMQKIKAVTKLTGPDEMVDEMFLLMPDGKEIKTMQLNYKRK
ncbi:MAG: DUF1579 domain-containing protein [Candidatus Latescibacterota bacterium]